MLADYERRLKAALDPSYVRVYDESLGHEGHVGAEKSGPISHLGIEIEAASLKGLTPVAQHQKIYAVLRDELASGEIHALRIKVL